MDVEFQGPSLLSRVQVRPLVVVLLLAAAVSVVELVFLLRLGSELAFFFSPESSVATVTSEPSRFAPARAVVSLAILLVIQILLHILLSVRGVNLSESIVRDLRREAFHSVLKKEGSRKLDSGDADFVVLVLTRELGANLVGLLFGAGNVMLLAVLILASLSENILVTVGGALAVSLVLLTTVPGARKLKRRARAAEEAEGSALSFVTSAVDARLEVVSFGVRNEVVEKGDSYFLETQIAREKSIGLSQTNSFLFRDMLLALLAASAVLYFTLSSSTSESTVKLFILGLRAVSVSGALNGARLALVRANSVYNVLSNRMFDHVKASDGSCGQQSRGLNVSPAESRPPSFNLQALRLECAEVTLNFGGGPLFDAQTWSAGPTGLVAVAGDSGVGKTSFLEALQGVLPVHTGSVSLNGVPVQNLSVEQRQTVFGYAPQFPVIMPGSVRDNLCFFRSAIEDEMLLEALRHAYLGSGSSGDHDYLEQLIGAGFRDLSGGERLRLGIARSLVCSPRVIIMDEPTSAVSEAVGSMIVATLRELAAERLVVVATHNPAIIGLADTVVNLNRKAV